MRPTRGSVFVFVGPPIRGRPSPMGGSMNKLLLLLTCVLLLLLAGAVPAQADSYYQVSPVRRQRAVGGRVDHDLGTSPDHTRGHRPEGRHQPGGDEPRRRHEPVRGLSVPARGDQEGSATSARRSTNRPVAASGARPISTTPGWPTTPSSWCIRTTPMSARKPQRGTGWSRCPRSHPAGIRFRTREAHAHLVDRCTCRRRRAPARRGHGIGRTMRRRS